MQISRTPLRISLAGGGTDLPGWYKEHGSMFISAAINKYIYITYHQSYTEPGLRIRYSKNEEVMEIRKIKHDIVRETLRSLNIQAGEITSHAEIPSGTGLGSSGSFGVGLLNALSPQDPASLAQEATRIQMDVLNYPIGLQDQYVSAYGGINCYEINQDGQVKITPLEINFGKLEKKLVLFYTGIKRDTNTVLRKSSFEGLEKIQEFGWDIHRALISESFYNFGELLNHHWEWKKRRGHMTTPAIDKYYERGMANGAVGGKLIGAGGGGFLMFYTEDRDTLIQSMPLKYVPFVFDMTGSKLIYENNPSH